MPHKEPASYKPFPATQWSLVARAGNVDTDVKRKALTELLERYMPAVKSYLTLSKRLDHDKADDLMQSFLASKVLEQDLIERADQARGKFRTFLLTALDRFIVNQHRYDSAQKRAPTSLGSIEESAEPARNGEQAETFDVAWARQVIDTAVTRMQQECKGSGRKDLWLVFDHRVLAPTLRGEESISYEELMRVANFASPVQAANALVTAKRMFIRILKSVVSEYEGDEADVDGEINDLHNILAKAGIRT